MSDTSFYEGFVQRAKDRLIRSEENREANLQANLNAQAQAQADRRNLQAAAAQNAQTVWATRRDELRIRANRATSHLRDAEHRLDVATDDDDLDAARAAAVDRLVWDRASARAWDDLNAHEALQPGRR